MSLWSRPSRPAAEQPVAEAVALAALEADSVAAFRATVEPLLVEALGAEGAQALLGAAATTAEPAPGETTGAAADTAADSSPAVEAPEQAAGLLVLLRAALRRLAELEGVRASERRLADAQALAHMGSYDWDIAADTNTWSDELFRIYGTEPQSFNASYERFLSFIHADDRQRIIEVHQQAYATGSGYSMEERISRPSGEVRHLLSTGEVVLGADGKPARMRGVCWDITERKHAEDEVRRSGEQLAAVVGGLPEAVLVLDDAGAVSYANVAAEQLFGWSRDELTRHPVTALLPDSGLPDATGSSFTTHALTRQGDRISVGVRAVTLPTSHGSFVAAFVRAPAVSPRTLPLPQRDVTQIHPRSASR